MTSDRRRLTIADAMALVAATALAIPLARQALERTPLGLGRNDPLVRGVRLVALGTEALVPCVALWTFTLLGLRLLAPRPRRRRLVRQPGWLALSIGGLMSLLGTAIISATLALGPHTPTDPRMPAFVILLLPLFVCPGILASWLTAAMAGRRRDRRDWIERAGVVLGWYWIVAAPLCFWILLNA